MSTSKKQHNQKAIDFSKYRREHVLLKLAYNGATYDGLAMQDSTRNTIEETFLRVCIRLRLIPNIYSDINDVPFVGIDEDVEDDNKNEKKNQEEGQEEEGEESEINNNNNNNNNRKKSAAENWIGFSRCGRTDKGVSARGNAFSLHMRGGNASSSPSATSAASFSGESSSSSSLLAYDKLLNRALPSSIRILGWSFVPEDFDARFSCTARSYRYFFEANPKFLNVGKMQKAASLLVGEHDFRNLCVMDVVNVSNFVRTVKSAQILSVANSSSSSSSSSAGSMMHYLEIRATAFLYHQIRCIMTILFSVGAELEKPEIVTQLLDVEKSFPRKPYMPLADPLPLVLWECEFDPAVVKGWNLDEGTQKNLLQELTEERDAANVRAAVCAGMIECQLQQQQQQQQQQLQIQNTNQNQNQNQQQNPSSASSSSSDILPTWRKLLFSGGSIAMHQGKYVSLKDREKEKSYQEKVAALSSKKKERHEENNAARRQREN